MPSKIILNAYPAKPTSDGHFTVAFHLDGRPDPLPRRIVEVKNTAEALSALEDYAREAEATGLQLALSMRVADGSRAPRGFKAAQAQRPFYHRVNV